MKRFFDFTTALFLIVVFSPLMLVIALLVRIKMGSPVLFSQTRPGLHGTPFVLYKFRTMKNENDTSGQPLSDEKRLTAFGIFLRKTSLDELPQLFNVIKGELSLVGPRPLLVEYLSRYTPRQARRHEVRPGITGWAQVNGRNAIEWEEKFEYDIWYVENHSFLLDLKILWLTVMKVIRSEGVSQNGHVTMSKFLGSGKSQEKVEG